MRLLSRFLWFLLILMALALVAYMAASWYAGRNVERLAVQAGISLSYTRVDTDLSGLGWEHSYENLFLREGDLRISLPGSSSVSHSLLDAGTGRFHAPGGIEISDSSGMRATFASFSSTATLGFNQRLQGSTLSTQGIEISVPNVAEIQIDALHFDAVPSEGAFVYEGRIEGLVISGPLAARIEEICVPFVGVCLPSNVETVTFTGRVDAFVPLSFDLASMTAWREDGGLFLLQPLSVTVPGGDALPHLGVRLQLDANLQPEGEVSTCLIANSGEATCSAIALFGEGAVSVFGQKVADLPQIDWE